MYFFNLKQIVSIVSASDHHNELEKTVSARRSVTLMKNKIEPVNVTQIHQHRESVEKVTIVDK